MKNIKHRVLHMQHVHRCTYTGNKVKIVKCFLGSMQLRYRQILVSSLSLD